MKLIKEHTEQVNLIVEEKLGKGKEYFIEGVFLQSNLKNRNGRMYPKDIMSKEVKRYNEEYISKNRAFGELGHPETPAINLDRVSHMITKLYPDGNNIMGKAKILDTPNGKIVKSLLDGGACLGVSTRGVGSLKPQNGYQLVQDDFHLATAADIVADPSAPDAFVRGIMENEEWIMTNKGWKSVHHDRARKLIKEAKQSDIEDVALRIFKSYISKL